MQITEAMARKRLELTEQLIRSVVREEIVRALGALAREADHLDMPYETAELDSRALENIKAAANGAVQRLTCPHEQYSTSVVQGAAPYCRRCGEPQPEPENPFEDRPLDPDCKHAFATEFRAEEPVRITVCQICEGVKA